jgi:hypothetical protein
VIPLTQPVAQDVILKVAGCECTKVYSGVAQNAQLALGRCKGSFPSAEERLAFIDKMTACTDGDYAGLAIRENITVSGAGETFHYADAVSRRPSSATPDGPSGRQASGGRRGSYLSFLVTTLLLVSMAASWTQTLF